MSTAYHQCRRFGGFFHDMGARGRKSKAHLSVAGSGVVRLGDRPSPPSSLSEEEAMVWRRVVDGLPSDWFRPEHLDLLAAYCRCVAMATALSEQINRAPVSAWVGDDDMLKALNKLLAMRDREVARAVQMATKMRITHQSSYTDKAAGTAKKNGGGSSRPWEDAEYKVE